MVQDTGGCMVEGTGCGGDNHFTEMCSGSEAGVVTREAEALLVLVERRGPLFRVSPSVSRL